jgi:hypothetical protein
MTPRAPKCRGLTKLQQRYWHRMKGLYRDFKFHNVIQQMINYMALTRAQLFPYTDRYKCSISPVAIVGNGANESAKAFLLYI